MEKGEPITVSLVQEVLSKDKTVIISPEKSIILDLEGKTLKTTAEDYVIKNYGQLEIVDSSEDMSGKIISTTNSTIYNGSSDEDIEDSGDTEEEETITIDLNGVKKHNESDEYYFEYDEDNNEIINTNCTFEQSLSTTAKGYLPIDLTQHKGKYILNVQTEISAYYSYYINSVGSVYISNRHGLNTEQMIAATNTEKSSQSIELAGGQIYYLNFEYNKCGYNPTNREDKFKIKSVTLKKKQEGTLTITSGNVEVDITGTQSKYYAAIENAGILNVNNGNINSSRAYNIGVATMDAGTSYINNGNFNLSGDKDIAICGYKKAGFTKVDGGEIYAYNGIGSMDSIGNVVVNNCNFSEKCNNSYIYTEGSNTRMTLNGLTLNMTKNSNSGYPIYIAAGKNEMIVNKCNINNDNNWDDCIIVRGGTDSIIEINESHITGNNGIYIDDPTSLYINKSIFETTEYAIYGGGIYGRFGGNITDSTITIKGDDRAIYCDRMMGFTIDNTDISNILSTRNNEAICINSGTLTIKGNTNIKTKGPVIYGRYYSTWGGSFFNSKTINIESGTLESLASQAINIAESTGDITIGKKNGEVNEDITIKSPISPWTITGVGMNLNFYGGKLIGGQDKVIGMQIADLEEGYDLVENEYDGEDENADQYCVITLGKPKDTVEVFENDSENKTNYGSLTDAVKACNNQAGDKQTTIKLLKNINQGRQVRIEQGQNIKIDLNGHKIYAMANDVIYNEGKLEIVDTAEVKQEPYNLNTLTGATIIHNAVIKEEEQIVHKGNVTIGNGIKVYSGRSGDYYSGYYKLIINEGILNTDGTEISISGDWIYAIYNTGALNLNGGSITEGKNNYTYLIYDDGTETSTIKGVVITGYGEGIYNNNAGTLKFGEGTIMTSQSGGAIINQNKGKIVINGATISIDGLDNNEIITNNGTGTIEISSGELTANGRAGYVIAIRSSETQKIDITGGTLTTNCGSGSVIYNVYGQKAEINIHGGTLIANADNAYGIDNYSTGTVNITGGEIISEKSHAIYNRSGTVILGEKMADDSTEEPNSNTPKIRGKVYGVYNNKTFKFFDGAITGAKDNSIYGSITEKEPKYQVIREDNGDNTETATLQKVYILEIKESESTGEIEKFVTVSELQDKLSSLDNTKSYTVNVLNDFSISSTETITIPEGAQITFDTNGHTVKGSANSLFSNSGTLTIQDSSEGAVGCIKNELNGTNDSRNSVIKNEEGGTLNLNNAKIISSGAYGYGVYTCNSSTLQITDGTITTSGTYGYGIYAEGSVEMNGGTISTKNTYAHSVYNKGTETVKLMGVTITATGYGVYSDNTGVIEIGNYTIAENLTVETTITTNASAIYNNGTGTIKINGGNISNTSSEHVVYNNASGTIEINDGKIEKTNYSGYGIYNASDGIINLKGGSITSQTYGIYNYNYPEKGTINIEGGQINCKSSGIYDYNYYGGGTINVTGGKITSEEEHGIYNSGTLTIGVKMENDEKGTSKPSQESPIIKGKRYGVYNNGKFYYYDGIIIGAKGQSINPNITDAETDYQIVKEVNEENNEETATLDQVNIMEINDVKYTKIKDVQDAINQLDGSREQTIKLINNVYMFSSDKLTIPNDKNIVLDLNGNELESSSTTTIENNGKLKIVDNSGTDTGKILGVSKTIINNKGNLTIEGGTYNSINYAGSEFYKVIHNTGTLTWNKGDLILNVGHNYGIFNDEDGTIDWEDGNITVNQSSDKQYGIYMNNAKTLKWEKGEIYLHATNANYFRPDLYGIFINSNATVNVKDIVFSATGAYLGTYGGSYESYHYFIYSENKAEEKAIVTLENCTKNIEDYRGYKNGISGTNMEITILGGTFEELDNDISVTQSNVNINGGTFADEVTVGNDAKLIVKGEETSINNIRTGGELIVENGTINHIYSEGGNVTIKNGIISSENSDAIEISNCQITIEGGKLQSSYRYGLYVWSGTAVCLGGEIESTKAQGVYINSGSFTMGIEDDDVSIEEPMVKGATYGVQNAGGTFNFYDGVIEGGQKAIVGKVTKMPENCRVQYENEEKIAYLKEVSESEKQISVGERYFTTMEAAIAHASENSGTILLHRELTIENPLTIPAEAQITINLNGHSLTADFADPLITNNGILTIIDDLQDVVSDKEQLVTESKVENKGGYAIKNTNTLTIGIKDEDISEITPSIIGNPNAILNEGTLKWYDGKIDGKITETEQESAQLAYVLARRIKAGAENVLSGAEDIAQAMVQSPKIKLSSKLPIWTNQYVEATMYTTGRVMLDIVNESENVELRSISVKKEWEMPDEEADNYMAVIRLMKVVDGKKVPVTDKQGKTYEVQIIGNNIKKFDSLPVSRGGKVIEYALEEIAIKKRVVTSDGEEWVEVPMSQFNVKYQKSKTE